MTREIPSAQVWFAGGERIGYDPNARAIVQTPGGALRVFVRREGDLAHAVSFLPEFKGKGPTRCTIELQAVDRAVKLTITHEIDRPESELIKALSVAWPLTVSNLKSLLETGEVAVTTHPGH
jgi:hypothetical protein